MCYRYFIPTHTYKGWAQLLALATRLSMTYCAYSSSLTLQESYTSNEVQDSTYRSVMTAIWCHKIVAKVMEP
jgi:hypothetical protein